ncbi:hypothetical protein ACJX0J_034930, partial [Zea mays]
MFSTHILHIIIHMFYTLLAFTWDHICICTWKQNIYIFIWDLSIHYSIHESPFFVRLIISFFFPVAMIRSYLPYAGPQGMSILRRKAVEKHNCYVEESCIAYMIQCWSTSIYNISSCYIFLIHVVGKLIYNTTMNSILEVGLIFNCHFWFRNQTPKKLKINYLKFKSGQCCGVLGTGLVQRQELCFMPHMPYCIFAVLWDPTIHSP